MKEQIVVANKPPAFIAINLSKVPKSNRFKF